MTKKVVEIEKKTPNRDKLLSFFNHLNNTKKKNTIYHN